MADRSGTCFDHEKLRVYQAAIAFVGWADDAVKGSGLSSGLVSQFERAAASVALNIAEGNGKQPTRDRARFLEIARGSALECAACIDVFVAKSAMSAEAAREGKAQLLSVVRMLTALMNALAERTAETGEPYELRRIEEECQRYGDGERQETE